jgi:hypothetical protein
MSHIAYSTLKMEIVHYGVSVNYVYAFHVYNHLPLDEMYYLDIDTKSAQAH